VAGWIFDFLSTAGFQPHGVCLHWRTDVFWLHMISDGLIALAYFSIPVAILYFAWRRPDMLRGALPMLFASFIVACGVTHLMGVWTLWVPDYGVEGILKAMTAGISVVTATAIWPMMPRLLAIPSPRELEESNRRLAGEIAERRRAERRLAELNEELERRVGERTASLALANKELREARARAEAAHGAKSAFLAAMSHEIRTPMNGVLGMLSLVERGRLDPEQAHYIDVAEESANGLLGVINDILDYSRLEARAVTLDTAAYVPEKVVRKVADRLQASADRKGLVLAVEVDPGVPAEVIGDPLRLRQVLINLVGNAVKFTERGEIRVRLVPAGPGRLAFEVSDTGAGIAPELIGCLFDRFTQGKGSARRHGSGLGLAISRALVELMGGEITVESVQGRGSRFRFTIACREAATELAAPTGEPGLHIVPVPRGAGESSAASAAESAAGIPGAVAGRARVLVVEDNAVNQLLVAKLLARAGHDATIAGDGETALAHLRSAAFDLVLMDVQLPGMDGVSVTRHIRDLPGPVGAIPVIALTANAMAGDRDRYLAAGMDDYLSKPIDANQLYLTIARQLERVAAAAPCRRSA
jgi:signal transduction histidine kinase/ActR/RegA family two-component response regulator